VKDIGIFFYLELNN